MKIRKVYTKNSQRRKKSRIEILLERQRQLDETDDKQERLDTKNSQRRKKSRIEILLERQGQLDDKQERLDNRLRSGVFSSSMLATSAAEELDKKIERKISLQTNNSITRNLEGIVGTGETYAVLANGCDDERGCAITEILFFYKLLKDNNVKDKNITLLLHNKFHKNYTNMGVQEDIRSDPRGYTKERSYDAEINQKIRKYASLTRNEIKVNSEEGTKEKFLEAIKNLKSNYNDRVYIFYIAHGFKNEAFFNQIYQNGNYRSCDLEESFTNVDLNEAINTIRYERLIVVGSTCHSASLLKDLDKPNKIRNTLAIASSGAKKISYDSWGMEFVVKYEKYRTFSRIIKSSSRKHQITPFYFDTDRKKCPWLKEPFIDSSRKR